MVPAQIRRRWRWIATHILAFEDESHVQWFEGNFQD
jgi:hypothetical protein